MKIRLLSVCLLCVVAAVLPAVADAPPGRYTIGSGTVYDARTKLTWEQTVDAGSYSQANAVNYCGGLTLAGGGWRLPSRAELLSIVDPTVHDPAIDATAFPNTPLTIFWTSTPYAGLGGYGWLVDFIAGYTGVNDASVTLRVRCVR